jgi:hypothetical protein
MSALGHILKTHTRVARKFRLRMFYREVCDFTVRSDLKNAESRRKLLSVANGHWSFWSSNLIGTNAEKDVMYV